MENQSQRRTSFVDVRRKSLTFSNIFNSEGDQSIVEKSKLSMKSYLESLVQEKEDWKKILHQKKKIFKEREDKSKCELLKIRREDVEKYISTEDKLFLENKPNYLEMLHTVEKFINAVTYLNEYKLDIIDYYNKACNEIEIANKNFIDEMCSQDLCDICNKINCNEDGHKFTV